jgi:hypothetical protein
MHTHRKREEKTHLWGTCFQLQMVTKLHPLPMWAQMWVLPPCPQPEQVNGSSQGLPHSSNEAEH